MTKPTHLSNRSPDERVIITIFLRKMYFFSQNKTRSFRCQFCWKIVPRIFYQKVTNLLLQFRGSYYYFSCLMTQIYSTSKPMFKTHPKHFLKQEKSKTCINEQSVSSMKVFKKFPEDKKKKEKKFYCEKQTAPNKVSVQTSVFL